MNEIIQISKEIIGNSEVNSVNAREIHEYLQVKTKFTMWIQRAIKKYDFIENVDYISFITDPKSGKRDFIVTLDMAKELAMLENNKKGKEIRKYFIACEKKALSMGGDNTQVLNMMAKSQEMMIEFMKNQQSTNELILEILQDIKSTPKQITNEYLDPEQLETIKNKIYQKADELWIKYEGIRSIFGDEASLVRHIFSSLNKCFGTRAYYRIKASDFQKAYSFIESLDYRKKEPDG